MVPLVLVMFFLQLLTGAHQEDVYDASAAEDMDTEVPLPDNTDGVESERQLRERRRKSPRNKARARGPPGGQFILVQAWFAARSCVHTCQCSR